MSPGRSERRDQSLRNHSNKLKKKDFKKKKKGFHPWGLKARNLVERANCRRTEVKKIKNRKGTISEKKIIIHLERKGDSTTKFNIQSKASKKIIYLIFS